MPIHIRAEPGEYAEACLLPGDPLRAKYIAETYFDNPVQRNGERGMLGYSGEWEGKPLSVQATGMGCPSAAIVMEELVQLGVKRFLRVGTCGGLQQDLKLGDLIVAVSAVPADGTARHYVGGEPHTPTADWELVHEAVHAAKELDQPVRVGAIASSDTFYDPDPGRHKRWSARGVLGVEMEAAVLFTIGSLRGVKAGCLLTVSDIVIGDEFTRISDDELRAAVDRMTTRRTGDRQLVTRPLDTVFLVNPASENGATGRRWPELAHTRGLARAAGRRAPLRAARAARGARADGGRRRREPARRRRRRRHRQRGRERDRRARGRRAGGDPARDRLGLRPHLRHPATPRGGRRGRAARADPR